MASEIQYRIMKIRRKTAALMGTLLEGQLGLETDTRRVLIGTSAGNRVIKGDDEDTSFYIMSTFAGAVFGEGDTELYVCVSIDGKTFRPTSTVGLFGSSTTFLRDPSLVYYGGEWVVVYTTSAGFGTSFGVATSSDLATWAEVAPAVGGFPAGTDTVWAPEAFIDSDGSLHVFVAVSDDGMTTFSIYETHPTSAELTTWSTPVLVYAGDGDDLGVAIDAYIIKNGGLYYLWYAGYTGGLQYIKYATSPNLLGPYTQVKTGDWAGWGNDSEGPCVIQTSPTNWRIYFDQVVGGVRTYYYSDSTDLETWSAKAAVLNYQFGLRHGTVVKCEDPSALPNLLLSSYANPSGYHNFGGVGEHGEVMLGGNTPAVIRRGTGSLATMPLLDLVDAGAASLASVRYDGSIRAPTIDVSATSGSFHAGVYTVDDEPIAQKDIYKLTAGDSPEFASVNLTRLSDGFIPYHRITTPELISNGGFDSDTTDWAADFGTIASVGGGQAGNCLELTRVSGVWQDAYAGIVTLVPGLSYTFSVWVKSGTSGNEAFLVGIDKNGGGEFHSVAGTSSAVWTQYSVTFLATGAWYWFLLYKDSATPGTMLFDTASVKRSTELTDSPISTNGTKTKISNLVSYANDAAAGAAGLTSGELYTVTGTDPLQIAQKI